MEHEVRIPKWFLGLQTVLIPIIVALAGWAGMSLQNIKVEIAVLSTKVDMTRELQSEVTKLEDRLRQLERAVDRGD